MIPETVTLPRTMFLLTITFFCLFAAMIGAGINSTNAPDHFAAFSLIGFGTLGVLATFSFMLGYLNEAQNLDDEREVTA